MNTIYAQKERENIWDAGEYINLYFSLATAVQHSYWQSTIVHYKSAEVSTDFWAVNNDIPMSNTISYIVDLHWSVEYSVDMYYLLIGKI